MMTNAQNTRADKSTLNMSTVKMKASSLKKATTYQALPSWKMLNLNSTRCMKAQPRKLRIDLHLLLIKREV